MTNVPSSQVSTPPTWSPPEGITPLQRKLTMAGTLMALLLAALDQTIVATAGPAIQKDLAIPAGLYAWLTSSYLVASVATLPLFGKLSDRWGRKALLLTAIMIFGLGSLLCALSPTTTVLIVARAVQGVGSAGLFTSAFAVVADLYSPVERGKYQGLFSGVFGLASVAGPLAGGAITDSMGWHWVFLINVPVGIIATLLVLRIPPLRTSHEGARPPLDLLGALLLMAAVVPLLLGLSLVHPESATPGEPTLAWTSPLIIGLLGIAVVNAILFIWRERRAADPLLDLRLFGNRTFALGNLANFLFGATFLSSVVFMPLFMVNVVGLSATGSGLTMTPLTLGVVAGNIISGQLVARLGRYKGLIISSSIVLICAFAVMGFTLESDASQASVTVKMILVGLGLGPSMPIFTIAIQSSVPPRQVGVATSTVTFARNLGSTLGVAVMGTVFANTLASQTAEQLATLSTQDPEALAHASREALTAAVSGIYQVNAGLTVLALIVTLFLPAVVLRERPGAAAKAPMPMPME